MNTCDCCDVALVWGDMCAECRHIHELGIPCHGFTIVKGASNG